MLVEVGKKVSDIEKPRCGASVMSDTIATDSPTGEVPST
jgi:hypothetical protein